MVPRLWRRNDSSLVDQRKEKKQASPKGVVSPPSPLPFLSLHPPPCSTILPPVSPRGCAPTWRLSGALSWSERRRCLGADERPKECEPSFEEAKRTIASLFSLSLESSPRFGRRRFFFPVAAGSHARPSLSTDVALLHCLSSLAFAPCGVARRGTAVLWKRKWRFGSGRGG